VAAPVKIVIAPDKFKGSLSAPEVAAAIRDGFIEVLPQAQFDLVPVADGGDGTMTAIIAATHGRSVSRRVTGPDGALVDASFGLFESGAAAVVELAQASGLMRIAAGRNDPRTATSYGTGELIGAAIDAGARRVIVAVGGSATNDAGAGALQALGAKFLDERGLPIGPGGAELARLARIERAGLTTRIGGISIEIATDVRNPLCGPDGASAVYGPQKGADAVAVRELDAALGHFADVAGAEIGADMRLVPGTGAAGGFGFGFLALAGATLRNGAELVLTVVDFDNRLEGARLVVTGEGKLDRQTLSGKTPMAVAQAAKRRGVPTVAIAGTVECDRDELERIGIAQAEAVKAATMTLDEALIRARELTTSAAARVARAWRPKLL
jgi:glycerate kinase